MIRKFFGITTILFFGIQPLLKAQFDSTISLSGGLNALRIAVPFLTIAPDSRSAALGDAGVASVPDVNSQHWNPAKFPFIEGKKWGIGFSYTPWLRNLVNDINLTHLTGFYQFDKMQAVSGSLTYFAMGEITFKNDLNEFIQVFNPNEFAIDFAYSRKFSDRIAGAMAFRYIRSDLTGNFTTTGTGAGKPGTSFAADLAVYYQNAINLAGKSGEMALGANISNIGTKLSYNEDPQKEFIPINMRVGGRVSLNIDQYNGFSYLLDINKLLVPTPPIYNNQDQIIDGKDPNVSVVQGMIQSFYDAPGGIKEELQEIYIATGIEYWYARQFAIRAGYFYENQNKGNRKYITLGAGLRYNVFNIDFSYLIPTGGFNSPMANTLRFSISFEFDPASTKSNRGK